MLETVSLPALKMVKMVKMVRAFGMMLSLASRSENMVSEKKQKNFR